MPRCPSLYCSLQRCVSAKECALVCVGVAVGVCVCLCSQGSRRRGFKWWWATSLWCVSFSLSLHLYLPLSVFLPPSPFLSHTLSASFRTPPLEQRGDVCVCVSQV